MPTRTARTGWTGTLEQGVGKVELTSSKLATYEVSFPKRAAEDAGGATSPEELIAAAHSSCYARQPSTGTTAPVMALAPSPARNAMTAATSAGDTSRPRGCWAAKASAAGSP